MWSVSYLISGSELIYPRWSARNCHCLRLLLGVVDCCVSRLVKQILLSEHYDSKQLREAVDLLLTFHPSLVWWPLPYVGHVRLVVSCLTWTPARSMQWPYGYLFFYLKTAADGMAPVLVWYSLGFFDWVVSMLAGDTLFDVTSITKVQSSPSVANYRPIPVTPVFSEAIKRLVSVRLRRFIERSGVLPTTQFAYWKRLCTCDVLLHVSHTLQSAFASWYEARAVQIDLSAACDRVNHQGILYKLCSVSIGCPVCIWWHNFY